MRAAVLAFSGTENRNEPYNRGKDTQASEIGTCGRVLRNSFRSVSHRCDDPSDKARDDNDHDNDISCRIIGKSAD